MSDYRAAVISKSESYYHHFKLLSNLVRAHSLHAIAEVGAGGCERGVARAHLRIVLLPVA